MVLIVGAVLIAAAVVGFMYSLPRGGTVAPFVGTAWEPYVVVLIVGGLCFGIVMTINGVIELAK